MVFSSVTFLFYVLPIIIVVYALLPTAWRNGWLLTASLIFYLWGSGTGIGLLLVVKGGNWLLGLWADYAHKQQQPKIIKAIIGLALVFNLGILGYFKYANFFVAQIQALFPGAIAQWQTVALPIGISFFIFQALAYSLDVAWGNTKVEKNLLRFLLFVSLFPQLIAGPIVRYQDIANQLDDRSLRWSQFSTGMTRFLYGLVKKVAIADAVAPVADLAFNQSLNQSLTPGLDPSSALTAGVAGWGMIAYTLQIYFDFSGYSDMAIGLGTIFGFRFPENFRRPYSALSVTDFWRRWHMTLSGWFRDYVYIPLGGSRVEPSKVYRNLAIVFLLTGLWHGANWTFILWGVYHGSCLTLERLLGIRMTEAKGLWETVLRRSLTLILVMLGWVLFRSATLASAGVYYAALGGGNFSLPGEAATIIFQASLPLLVGGAIAFLPGQVSWGRYLTVARDPGAIALRWAVLLVGVPLSFKAIIAGNLSPFLYFQF